MIGAQHWVCGVKTFGWEALLAGVSSSIDLISGAEGVRGLGQEFQGRCRDS